jgi:hypothetical protein
VFMPLLLLLLSRLVVVRLLAAPMASAAMI